MSEQSSSAPGKSGPAKPPVSPVRNVIGVVVLLAVVVVGGLEVWAKTGYNTAVNKLNTRSQDENKELMTTSEAETLLGKEPDDAGSEVQDGSFTYMKKTYTWKGLINSYTLTAYYTKAKDPLLHHYEAGEKFTPEPKETAPKADASAMPPPGIPQPAALTKRGETKGRGKKADEKKPAADEKKPAADEKKPAADEKKPAADEKKPAADEKKPSDADKAKAPEKAN